MEQEELHSRASVNSTNISDLAQAIGITEANLSLSKRGKVKGVRFETLAAICRDLEC